MLPISECRKLLGGAVSARLTDKEIEALRDSLDSLARVGLGSIELYKRESSYENEALSELPEGLRDEVEERAAIMQFDAGMTRGDAVRRALAAYRWKGEVH